MKKLMQDN